MRQAYWGPPLDRWYDDDDDDDFPDMRGLIYGFGIDDSRERRRERKRQARMGLMEAALPADAFDIYRRFNGDIRKFNEYYNTLSRVNRARDEEKRFSSTREDDYSSALRDHLRQRAFNETQRDLERSKAIERIRRSGDVFDPTFHGAIDDEESAYSVYSLFNEYKKTGLDGAVNFFSSLPLHLRNGLTDWINYLNTYPQEEDPNFKFTPKEKEVLDSYNKILIRAGVYSDNPVQDVNHYEDAGYDSSHPIVVQ